MAIDHEKYPHALPAGTILAGEFIIESVLGEGGFGITYAAVNHKTSERVAVKEYFPDTMATRIDPTRVAPYSGDRGENFEYGKECFLREAQTLAEFIGNEHIVRIFSYFEENGTAYFAMEYVEGQSFDRYIADHGGRLSYADTCRILFPIMDALYCVHEKGIIHRDISPDNIYITDDGGIRLLDFGAARYSLGDRSCSLDVVLKPGYAPKEQYTRRGRQGPFTDIYALGATFYYALTGKRPLSSIDRLDEDDLARPSALGADIGPAAEEALLQALELRSQDRYQSMIAFKQALTDADAMDHPKGVPAADTGAVADTPIPAVPVISVPPILSSGPVMPADSGMQAAPYMQAPGTASAADAPMQAAPYASQLPYAPADQNPLPALPQKKKNTGLILGLAATAVLLIGLAVGILFWSGILSGNDDASGLQSRRDRGSADQENNNDSSSGGNGSADNDRLPTPTPGEISGDGGNDVTPTPTEGDEHGKPANDYVFERTVKVGIINSDPAESDYRYANVEDMEAMFCAENGYDASFVYTIRDEEQMAAAEKFIADGVDYLLVYPLYADSWDDILWKAEEAGIRVILFDSWGGIQEDCYTARVDIDYEEEGRIVADWLAGQKLGEYRILQLQGVELGITRGRFYALSDKVSSDPDWTVVHDAYANWDSKAAEDIVSSVIASGEKFNVIYAENASMAEGATRALDNAGITHGKNGDVIIISVNGDTKSLERVASGSWNMVVQDSPRQASVVDDIIRRLEKGEKLTQMVFHPESRCFDTDHITKADIEKYGF